jgi:putative ABC transport system substrate-binding protein
VNVRRILVTAIAAELFAVPLPSAAQQTGKVWRVGILSPSRRPETIEAFAQRLRDLGYVEGQNLLIDARVAEGDYTRLPRLAAELLSLNVQVIVTWGNPGTLAALKATKTIPIVFGSGNPVGVGIVKSLSRPGGNATGLSLFVPELIVKHFQMLVGVVPNMRRVAVLVNPTNAGHRANLERIQAVAGLAGVNVVSAEAQTPGEIETAIAHLAGRGSAGLIWIADPMFDQEARRIADLALAHRFASITESPLYPGVGGLIGYGTNAVDSFRRLASFVDKILKGANPGDIPVEQPRKLELVINRRTAKALGLTIPPELLLLADKVFE